MALAEYSKWENPERCSAQRPLGQLPFFLFFFNQNSLSSDKSVDVLLHDDAVETAWGGGGCTGLQGL